MIKIATAECFTHGKIGRELHALAQNYEGDFGRDYIKNLQDYGDFDYNELSVTCSLFIPTIEAVVKILNVENPPKPDKLIRDNEPVTPYTLDEVAKIITMNALKLLRDKYD